MVFLSKEKVSVITNLEGRWQVFQGGWLLLCIEVNEQVVFKELIYVIKENCKELYNRVELYLFFEKVLLEGLI